MTFLSRWSCHAPAIVRPSVVTHLGGAAVREVAVVLSSLALGRWRPSQLFFCSKDYRSFLRCPRFQNVPRPFPFPASYSPCGLRRPCKRHKFASRSRWSVDRSLGPPRPPGVSDHEFVRLKIAALNWMDNNGRGNETNRYTDKGGVATDSTRYIPPLLPPVAVLMPEGGRERRISDVHTQVPHHITPCMPHLLPALSLLPSGRSRAPADAAKGTRPATSFLLLLLRAFSWPLHME